MEWRRRWSSLYWKWLKQKWQKKNKKKESNFVSCILWESAYYLIISMSYHIISYHHHHHHHHDVAMVIAHCLYLQPMIFRFYGICCRQKYSKKIKKNNPLYHIVGLNPFGLPSDCVLSVVALLCFCRLFLCALNRCLWICGLIFLWWGFGSNGRRGTCSGGMDGVDLVPSPMSTVCPLWSGYFEAFIPLIDEWLFSATKNK